VAQFPTVGSTFAGYTIDRQIGSGGMGAVFLATQTSLNRPVALKVLLPQLSEGAGWRQRFEREAAALASMDSPYVTQIHDFGEYDGCPYIAAQYVAGGDLATLLKAGPLAPDRAVQVAEQVSSALAEAHERGVVHRDIKPSNILLRGGNELHAYVCDFGIADLDGAQGLTQTGDVIGSLQYLAPERAGDGGSSASSDQYSLGCMLVEMLAGHPPFQGTAGQVLAAHASAAPPRWPGSGPVEARLNQIVARSMAKNPADRYPTMRDMLHDLRQLRSIIPASAPATGATIQRPVASTATIQRPLAPPPTRTAPQPVPASPMRRSPAGWIAAASVLAVVAVGALAWGLTRGSGSPTNSPAEAANASTPSATPSPSGSASRTPAVADPLRVGFKEVNPSCNGGAVAVIQEFDTSGTDADKIRRALERASQDDPHVAYANKAMSCGSLSLQAYSGARTYIPFYGPYRSTRAACEVAMRVVGEHGSAVTPTLFVAQLARGLDPDRQPYRCFSAFSASELPTLTVASDQDPVGADNFWVSEVEWTLSQLGFTSDITKDNHYTSGTARLVERYQRSRGIPASGTVDTATWEALQADYS